MTTPNNVAFPCAVDRKSALIAYSGYYNPKAVLLRFVTDGRVIDYVNDETLPGGAHFRRPVNARSLVDFLTDTRPTDDMMPLDRDLDGQWLGERAMLVYRVNGPHDPAIVFLAKKDATRLAEWMREPAGLPTPD